MVHRWAHAQLRDVCALDEVWRVHFEQRAWAFGYAPVIAALPLVTVDAETGAHGCDLHVPARRTTATSIVCGVCVCVCLCACFLSRVYARGAVTRARARRLGGREVPPDGWRGEFQARLRELSRAVPMAERLALVTNARGPRGRPASVALAFSADAAAAAGAAAAAEAADAAAVVCAAARPPRGSDPVSWYRGIVPSVLASAASAAVSAASSGLRAAAGAVTGSTLRTAATTGIRMAAGAAGAAVGTATAAVGSGLHAVTRNLGGGGAPPARERRATDEAPMSSVEASMAAVRAAAAREAMSSRHRPCRVLCVGLRGAGKTTLLQQWSIGPLTTKAFTAGMVVDSAVGDDVAVMAFDIGAGDASEEFVMRHIAAPPAGMVLVVDASATTPGRPDEARARACTCPRVHRARRR